MAIHPSRKQMELKDWLIIAFGGISVWGMVTGGVRLVGMPKEIDDFKQTIALERVAQAETDKTQEKDISLLKSRLDNFEIKQDYTNKSLDEMKGWLKNINARVK